MSFRSLLSLPTAYSAVCGSGLPVSNVFMHQPVVLCAYCVCMVVFDETVGWFYTWLLASFVDTFRRLAMMVRVSFLEL